jgi:transposase
MQLVRTKELTTEGIDHHGLVAAVSRDLGIADKINRRIGSKDPRRKIQPGLAVVAMIINGLGFTNRRLYLTPQFFQTKAIEFLFEEKVCAADFDDHALGKALDEISDYGSSKLYGELAFDVALEQGFLGPRSHLDTTSFSLHGTYEDDDRSC